MKYSDFVKSTGITIWTDAIKQWSTIVVDFICDDGGRSSVELDIENAVNEQGVTCAALMFDDFCKACGYEHPQVVGIHLSESADTMEEL